MGNGELTDKPLTSRRRNRSWIWFFVLLLLLTLLAMGINIWYNLRQQLKPGQLAEARSQWLEKGPREYDLDLNQTGSDSSGSFLTQVRDGKPVAVTLNGRPLEERLFRYYDMPGLFDTIERFQEIDSQPGAPRAFTKAVFDQNDGHVRYYLRSVLSTRQRVEIVTDLRQVSPKSP